MTNPVESELNGKHDVLTLTEEQGRIEQLVTENERLRSELAETQKKHKIDRMLLDARTMNDMPQTEEEFLRLVKEGQPFGELLDELEREFGLSHKP